MSESSEKRVCKGPCGRERNIADFNLKGIAARTGIPYRKSLCKTCDARNQREGRRRRKEHGPPPQQCMNCKRAVPLACDHDHQSGEYRGWLCKNCNTGLGLLGDNIQGLRRMLAYLERSSAPNSASRSEESERSRSPRRHGDSGGETLAGPGA